MMTIDVMMRMTIELPDNQIQGLARLCERERISQAEAIRRAVAKYLNERQSPAPLEASFGIWKDRDLDALDYEDKIRAEWGRRPLSSTRTS